MIYRRISPYTTHVQSPFPGFVPALCPPPTSLIMAFASLWYSSLCRSDDGSASDGVSAGGGAGDARASCDFCNRRKRRCNGERPCNGCVKAGHSDQCVFSAKRKTTSSKVRPRYIDVVGLTALDPGEDGRRTVRLVAVMGFSSGNAFFR